MFWEEFTCKWGLVWFSQILWFIPGVDQGSAWGKVCSLCREKLSACRDTQQKGSELLSFEKSPEFKLSPLCLQCSLGLE